MDKIVINDFNLKLNKNAVFKAIDCKKNSDIYIHASKVYDSLKFLVYELVEPIAVIAFSPKRNNLELEYLNCFNEIIYVIMTIGDKISNKISEFFKCGEYLNGIILNSMADIMLFDMEDNLLDIIKTKCIKRGLGINKRLEPATDLCLEVQKIIWEETSAKELINVDITESYMLKPVKSNTFILEANNHVDYFKMKHDCNGCKLVTCKMKNLKSIEIKIQLENITKTILGQSSENLMEIFLNNNIYLPFICSGRGSCGKCGVQVLKGSIEISEYDKKFYTDKELKNGFRLACKAYIFENIEIKLINSQEENLQSISDYINLSEINLNNKFTDGKNNYGVAIDIGTTTIALKLINFINGKDIKSYTLINSQRTLGADVISRIENSIKGKSKELRESIKKDILCGLEHLCYNSNIKNEYIKKIVISANTTMIHLLMGFDCKGLGSFPFKPFTLDVLEYSFSEIFENKLFNSDVVIMSGISAYIGGDILSGMLMCNFDKSEDIIMLIDIGTNGEMVIGNKNKILCTSAAAGPALEGGSISCGTGSIQGAISKVTIEKNNELYDFKYDTIGNENPIGICGSGIIDITSEALKNDVIDSTGLLIDEFFDNGLVIAIDKHNKPISFTQKDFREIQLAKASLRSAIETLINEFKCKTQDIKTVYISGGFGYHINIDNAINIGLIPKVFKNKIKIAGNTSLGGAKQYLLDNGSQKRIEEILNVTQEIYLSNNENFNDLYMNNMYF